MSVDIRLIYEGILLGSTILLKNFPRPDFDFSLAKVIEGLYRFKMWNIMKSKKYKQRKFKFTIILNAT